MASSEAAPSASCGDASDASKVCVVREHREAGGAENLSLSSAYAATGSGVARALSGVTGALDRVD
eukprot:1194301-Prorocentrum_minimum.AAC.10